MAKLAVFNSITLDGYFTNARGDMSWAYNPHKDPEWDAFVEGNAKGGGVLLFGRITYEMMERFWPTPAALRSFPVVAERMNGCPKVVFSRTMDKPTWNNTQLVKGELLTEIQKMKKESSSGMVILGSGSVVSQLAPEGLIDEYQIVITPVILGEGRTMFDDIKERMTLKLVQSRTFANGNVFLRYEPARSSTAT
jgi:dihydrofolate reductase